MPRGGLRSTSCQATWKHGATKTIRVPVALADRVLEITRRLDEGQDASQLDCLVTGKIAVGTLLDADDVAIAIDVLATVIQLKLSALRRESKRRSKADKFLINQWRNEIEALQRVIATLESR